MGKTALVVGATGLIGRELVEQLLEQERYDAVWIVVRRSKRWSHPKLHEVVGFEKMDETLPHIDDVYCALGTTIAVAGSRQAFKHVDLELPLEVARVAKQHGATRYAVVSAQGASLRSPFFYNRVKGELENGLKVFGFEHLIIARPSLLLGDRESFRLGEKAAEVVSRPFQPLLLEKVPNAAPIQALHVARALIMAGEEGQGTEVLTSGMMQRMSQ
ncbi:NAD-dependent epimerase/dehydratase family protein [Exiguobacterium sp. SH3S2]|uniref:NAD(P)H-binding protein n=1 Tax=unclassified Exiguobacterium TaxID=2644629 RepID=UPI00103B8110|nr:MULTISPECIES: NAD(P)H-binding protein [unclassified Exiguobacterium]TCI25768.1 NAD-dependent epimerase/dehydratase family protein [Exiguobacterium sp. SH5S4]TCI47264.1 NAD-dependent epimerase/dehydratase family protein [Exiguobacterium sp. SH3S3]TCI50741.1 NAD-dependent epimerase/dehydratase family protein [Exiguobacterium sp. SH5S13]TCI62229.1 NAD-dependent epimerase/dehydratase family protein [Exiguobacterium sp. SH3S1]TCI62411.1 NAD-dependent epimerase/dehydratase family protein [Exiguob